jgi:hypothetical protein
MKQRPLRFVVFLLALGSVFGFLYTIPASADNVYASIRGVVTDPAGAAVPNAMITATNIDTGIVTKTTSSGAGNYVFPQLAIGNYRVSATGPNFKTFQTNSFILAVNEVYDLPIRFELGSASETVEVNAEAAQVVT